MAEVIKQLRKAGFRFVVAALLEGPWCGTPMRRDRYVIVTSRYLDIRTWFFAQVRPSIPTR